MIKETAIGKGMASKRQQKIMLAPLGEYYSDILAVDAWVNGRAASGQAQSLLCSKLMQREDMVRDRVAYLARKRGIDPDILWFEILKGSADPIEADEIDLEKITAAAENQ